MIENTSEIPDGWAIQRLSSDDGFRYEAQHRQTYLPPKKHWWSRRPKPTKQWLPVYQSLDRDETVQFIRDAAVAMDAK